MAFTRFLTVLLSLSALLSIGWANDQTCTYRGTDQTVDLTGLMGKSYSFSDKTGENVVYFGVCQSVEDLDDVPPKCDNEAAVCVKAGDSYFNAGELDNYDQPQWTPLENGIQMVLQHGDDCVDGDKTTERSSSIQISCDSEESEDDDDDEKNKQTRSDSSPLEIEEVQIDKCTTVIKAKSKFACPKDRDDHSNKSKKYQAALAVFIGVMIMGVVATAIVAAYCLIRQKEMEAKVSKLPLSRDEVPLLDTVTVSPPIYLASSPSFSPMEAYNMQIYPAVYSVTSTVQVEELPVESDEEMAQRLQNQFDHESQQA